jgi:hypothetical protein
MRGDTSQVVLKKKERTKEKERKRKKKKEKRWYKQDFFLGKWKRHK